MNKVTDTVKEESKWADLVVEKLGHSSPLARQLIGFWVEKLSQTSEPISAGKQSEIVGSANQTAWSERRRFLLDLEGRFSTRPLMLDSIKTGFERHFRFEFQLEKPGKLNHVLFAVQTYYATVVRWLLWFELKRIEEGANFSTANFDSDDKTWHRRLAELQMDHAFAEWGWSGLEIDLYSWWFEAEAATGQADHPNPKRETQLLAQVANECCQVVRHAYQQIADSSDGTSHPVHAGQHLQMGADRYRNLYHDLLPRKARQLLGEYYTPRWLIQRTFEHLVNWPNPVTRLADPSCGSGGFLNEALMRWCFEEQWQEAIEANGKLTTSELPLIPTMPLSTLPVIGIDLNPLAVLTARANLAIACRQVGILGRVAPSTETTQQFPIFWGDSITGEAFGANGDPLENSVFELAGRVDCIVGNPPWISWDLLEPEYRNGTEQEWRRLGLFQAKGMDCILGKGKKDLSMLLAYVVSDKLLRSKGMLSFVITRAVLQNDGSGKGFRRFCLGDDMPLKVTRVDDFSAIQAFENANTKSVVLAWEKGSPTNYPVPVTRWAKADAKQKLPWDDSWPSARVSLKEFPETGAPSEAEDLSSPWVTASEQQLPRIRPLLGRSRYRAHEGVNTGGANGVYWFESMAPTKTVETETETETDRRNTSDTMVLRNLNTAGKRKVPPVEVRLETRFLYPLVRGSRLGRWFPDVDALVLMVQDPTRRSGVDPDLLRREAPLTYEYLLSMEEILRERAALKRFFSNRKHPSSAPFYSMFNVGSYTLSPYKVAWHRMKSPIGAAVLGPSQGKLVLPQETHAFVATETANEAFFLAAQLNHPLVNQVANSLSIPGSKSFASPHLLEKIQLIPFEPNSPSHQKIAAFANEIQAQVCSHRGKFDAETRAKIQELEWRVDKLFPSEQKVGQQADSLSIG